jgi:hypothetical protein
MDPGDQLNTFDELRCWKVENLRQFLTHHISLCTASGEFGTEFIGEIIFGIHVGGVRVDT